MEIVRRNTEYAIRALVHLAATPEAIVSAWEIADSQEVPVEYCRRSCKNSSKKASSTLTAAPREAFPWPRSQAR